MMTSTRLKLIAVAVAATTLVGSLGEASARNYTRQYPRGHYAGHRYHGGGAGAAIAGAALGIIGTGIAAAAASHYYNGYPAYNYGPGYGPAYGYDYHPGYGYYGPY